MRRIAALICAAIIMTITPNVAAFAEANPAERVRVAECFNPPATAIFLMTLIEASCEPAGAPHVWQTFPCEEAETPEDAARASVIGAYDMFFTTNADYFERVREQGLLRDGGPVFRERILLVGPAELLPAADGMAPGEIASLIFDRGWSFFSQFQDAEIARAERAFLSGVSDPAGNKNYADTGREEAELLLMLEDDLGFALVGESAYAQYFAMQRGDPLISVFADTGEYRVTYAGLLTNAGYRKARAAAADQCIEWLRGEQGREAVSAFRLGGMAPFSPAR